MGWKLNLMIFVIAAALISSGGWLFAVPLFILSIYGFSRSMKEKSTLVVVKVAESPRRRTFSRISKRQALGALLLLASLAALMEKGTLSPAIFASVGSVLLFWNRLAYSQTLWRISPVQRSVLLRRPFPFLYIAIAEVKLSTLNISRALSGFNQMMIIVSSPKPRIYLAFSAMAFSRSGAEAAVLKGMREFVRARAPLGAYLLPLDSKNAIEEFKFKLDILKPDVDELPLFLSTGDYDIISIQSEKELVTRLGAYRRVDETPTGSRSIVPPPREGSNLLLLLWEALRGIESRIKWPSPDDYTTFLGSLLATRSQPLGDRIEEVPSPSTSQFLLVKSLGTPPVELSRVQLRAVARIYS